MTLLEKSDIGTNNNIKTIKNDDIQNKYIVENTENQKDNVKTDNEKNENKIIKKDNIEDNENAINIIKDENENNNIKSNDLENNKSEINIITPERKEMEISEEELKKLSDIIFLHKIFNKKKTKIILQNDYVFIIKIINRLKEKEFELFFRYLNDIKISIFKIIVNGFIEFSFSDENKEKNILDIISRVISLFFNKNFFYFIYKKLSKYYRKYYKIDNIDSIKKFAKILKLWKLLYNPLIIAL